MWQSGPHMNITVTTVDVLSFVAHQKHNACVGACITADVFTLASNLPQHRHAGPRTCTASSGAGSHGGRASSYTQRAGGSATIADGELQAQAELSHCLLSQPLPLHSIK